MTAAGGAVAAGLPERPPISAPGRSDAPAARQPRAGLLGLLLVAPIAAVLAVGAGGADRSVLVLGPLVTYALPLVAMVAFWWEDWPGTRLRASWAGWADTALIAAGAVVLTGIGQIVVGDLDLRGMFDPSPGPGHVPTFPATMPLAAAAFVAMLQLTLVGEGWPLRRLPRPAAGLSALAISWTVALVAYAALAGVRHELGAVLVLIGAWQVLFYVAFRGVPFSKIETRALRLTSAHVVIVAGGILTFVVAHDVLSVRPAPLTAAAACYVAGVLVFGMLLEDWLGPVVTLMAALALAALLAAGLYAAAGVMRFTRASADEWVAHVALNAIGVSVILHVAIGRRWPFG
jgi:hypothetical protein